MKFSDVLTTRSKAKTESKGEVHAVEAAALWEYLVSRYDAYEMNRLFSNFAHDETFKNILDRGAKVLNSQMTALENKLTENEIPLPSRPPQEIKSSVQVDVIQDEMMYRWTLKGMECYQALNQKVYLSTSKPDIIKLIRNIDDEEKDLLQNLRNFGMEKGWLRIPPSF